MEFHILHPGGRFEHTVGNEILADRKFKFRAVRIAADGGIARGFDFVRPLLTARRLHFGIIKIVILPARLDINSLFAELNLGKRSKRKNTTCKKYCRFHFSPFPSYFISDSNPRAGNPSLLNKLAQAHGHWVA